MKKYDYLIHAENLINNLSYAGWKTTLMHKFKSDPCLIMATKNKEVLLIKIPLVYKDRTMDEIVSIANKMKSTAYLYNPDNKTLNKVVSL